MPSRLPGDYPPHTALQVIFVISGTGLTNSASDLSVYHWHEAAHARVPGAGMAFKLDNDDFEKSKRNEKPALFHFLDDTSKPWSKRCDFVVFYVNRRSFHADCIEFKSKSLTADKIVPQLKAGACWVSALKRTVEQYTGDKQRIKLRKFVFADNATPDAYLDANRQLLADPSIRYYHFDEVQGRSLTELQNSSVQDV